MLSRLRVQHATKLLSALGSNTAHLGTVTLTRNPYVTLRGFSSTTILLKKGGGKQEQKRTVDINSAKTAGRDDAHDFSNFRHEIDKATNFLKGELSRLRAGGLDLQAIEALNVNLGTSGGGGGGGPKKDGSRSGGKVRVDTVKLGDVAQVVPRGRIVVLMVGEKEVHLPLLLAMNPGY